MKKFKGKGVYGAVAVGKISVFKERGVKIERVYTPDSEGEKARFERAKAVSKKILDDIYKKALTEAGESGAEIFQIHQMLIDDDDFNDSVKGIIEAQKVNAEYAVARTAEDFEHMFSSMDDDYMKARAADVRDISDRLISALVGQTEQITLFDGGSIVCAADLTPSRTVSLDKKKTLAFVTAEGSVNSHTAILARNMGIPAVVDAGADLLKAIKDGDEAAVDGFTGEVFIDPDEQTRERLLKKQAEAQKQRALLDQLKGKDNVTIDGQRVDIFANIGSVDDIQAAKLNDAGGIGLFRSEFLYLESGGYPCEQRQFEVYKQVLEGMAGKKVIIRTLDIGADKKADGLGLKEEANPALGMRAIRLCLTRPEIFITQLRALYRASCYGDLGIMFPMITSAAEVEKIIRICADVIEQLKAESIPCREDVKLGIMIETPAAALISDRLAQMVDFFSVGTNDLTQYTLACDRQNPDLEQFVDVHHEAVLRLIEMSAQSAHKYGKKIGICGELAADTTLTKAFLRMGIDELSVSPSFVLKLRDTVRKTDLGN